MIFAFDTETWLIQPGLLAPPPVCGSIADPIPGSEALLSKSEAVAWFREKIRTARLIGANLVYDLGVMCAHDETLVDDVYAAAEAGRLHDVAIREALIDIAKGTYGIDPVTGRKLDDDEGARYPLALLVERHLGLDALELERLRSEKKDPDAWRLRYHELDGVPIEQWPENAKNYPKRDARYTVDVFLKQEQLAQSVPNGGNLHAEADQLRTALALHFASIWGVRTNGGRVGTLRAKVDAEWLANRERFKEAGIFRHTPGKKKEWTKNKKRLAELVTAAYNGNPPYTAPTEKFPNGQVATDADTLRDSGDPLLEELGSNGKVDKWRSTYVGVLERGVEVPINPRFNVLVSTTRCSSDYQQLPQKGGIRECHEARPGCVYCSVDYEGLELRTMAQRAIWEVGYSKMAEALNGGLDAHSYAAATFLGLNYEETFKRYKGGDLFVKSFRDLAKVFNFGKGGGLGAGGMAYQARAKDNVRFCLLAKVADTCGVERVPVKVQGKEKMVCAACVEVSRKYGNLWLDAWPEQRELFHRASQLTYGGALVDVMIPGANILRGGCGYTQWLNTPFQGLGAVGAKLATWRVSREMYTDRKSPLWGSRLVLMVHDELIAEMPLDHAPEAGERMAEIMRQAMREITPDLAPAIHAEPALSFIMSKEAKTIRDVNGRLQVWEPEQKTRDQIAA